MTSVGPEAQALIAIADSVASDWPSTAIIDAGPQGIITTAEPAIHLGSASSPYR